MAEKLGEVFLFYSYRGSSGMSGLWINKYEFQGNNVFLALASLNH